MFLASRAGAETWRRRLPGFLNDGNPPKGHRGELLSKAVHMTTSPSSRRKHFCDIPFSRSTEQAFVSLSLGSVPAFLDGLLDMLCTRNVKQLALRALYA